jgi:nitrile hydratase
VLAKNRHPRTHTREPRYLRGHVGVVHEHYGTQLFPDMTSQGIEQGGHLYCVRFEARELWGPSAPARNAIYADLWEGYLERVV